MALSSDDYERKSYKRKLNYGLSSYRGNSKLLNYLSDVPIYFLIPLAVFWIFIAIGFVQLSWGIYNTYFSGKEIVTWNIINGNLAGDDINIGKIFVDDTVFVKNINSTDWSIGLKVSDDSISTSYFTPEDGDLMIPVGRDGDGFFRLPLKGNLQYYISRANSDKNIQGLK